uniref:Uncharacterized protein n=1 Tax=Setaria italica TaxID=4555 RepID=K3ZND3_SETIT
HCSLPGHSHRGRCRPRPHLGSLTGAVGCERYNFTTGILPEGVAGYVLRPNGSFEVYLPGNCSFRVDSVRVRYSSRVASSIRPASIANIEGAKVLLAWVGVTEVDRNDDQFWFSAGPVPKLFPVDTFAHSPQCS